MRKKKDTVYKKKPELLSPAGDWPSLTSSVEAGCDAVYFGVKGMNMRHSASNFDALEMGKVMEFLRARKKKGYLALNITIYDRETGKIKRLLEAASSAGVNGVIAWDMAAMSMALELGMEVHLSTQASVSNFEAVRYYSSAGVKRIVLARECGLSEIAAIKSKIRKAGIDCEIEVFVHGAMCVSISGRCFLSQLSFNRSANRGDCLQPCRRKYRITDIPEEGRPECEYVLGEDYILSPRDLCTVMFIDRLIDAGVDAFKIEGRMRSPEYCAVVTSAYKEAIDAYFRGGLDDKLKHGIFEKLRGAFNRGFSSGFYLGRPEDLGGEISKKYEKIYVGEVVKYYKKISVAEILVKAAPLYAGQKILITGRSTPAGFFTLEDMEIEHSPVREVAQGTAVGVKVPFRVRRNDKVFIWNEEKSP
ncbi:MAG: U32 family peptidase [Candidatus Omnitrophica bacterium]|nr:U32 family peptidase [Candidatus Omnitrophota bacterium]